MVFESLSTEAAYQNKEFTFHKKSALQNPFGQNFFDANNLNQVEVLTKVSMHHYKITQEELNSE